MDFPICPDCGEYVDDGFCGCFDYEETLDHEEPLSPEDRARQEAIGRTALEEVIRQNRES